MSGRRAKQQRRDQRTDQLVDAWLELERMRRWALLRAAAQRQSAGVEFWRAQRRPQCH